jgi:hypothetical protein
MPAAFHPRQETCRHSVPTLPRTQCRHASCFRREEQEVLNGHDDPGETGDHPARLS